MQAVREACLAVGIPPADFDAYVRSESARWDKIIKSNNVRID